MVGYTRHPPNKPSSGVQSAWSNNNNDQPPQLQSAVQYSIPQQQHNVHNHNHNQQHAIQNTTINTAASHQFSVPQPLQRRSTGNTTQHQHQHPHHSSVTPIKSTSMQPSSVQSPIGYQQSDQSMELDHLFSQVQLPTPTKPITATGLVDSPPVNSTTHRSAPTSPDDDDDVDENALMAALQQVEASRAHISSSRAVQSDALANTNNASGTRYTPSVIKQSGNHVQHSNGIAAADDEQIKKNIQLKKQLAEQKRLVKQLGDDKYHAVVQYNDSMGQLSVLRDRMKKLESELNQLKSAQSAVSLEQYKQASDNLMKAQQEKLHIEKQLGNLQHDYQILKIEYDEKVAVQHRDNTRLSMNKVKSERLSMDDDIAGFESVKREVRSSVPPTPTPTSTQPLLPLPQVQPIIHSQQSLPTIVPMSAIDRTLSNSQHTLQLTATHKIKPIVDITTWTYDIVQCAMKLTRGVDKLKLDRLHDIYNQLCNVITTQHHTQHNVLIDLLHHVISDLLSLYYVCVRSYDGSHPPVFSDNVTKSYVDELISLFDLTFQFIYLLVQHSSSLTHVILHHHTQTKTVKHQRVHFTDQCIPVNKHNIIKSQSNDLLQLLCTAVTVFLYHSTTLHKVMLAIHSISCQLHMHSSTNMTQFVVLMTNPNLLQLISSAKFQHNTRLLFVVLLCQCIPFLDDTQSLNILHSKVQLKTGDIQLMNILQTYINNVFPNSSTIQSLLLKQCTINLFNTISLHCCHIHGTGTMLLMECIDMSDNKQKELRIVERIVYMLYQQCELIIHQQHQQLINNGYLLPVNTLTNNYSRNIHELIADTTQYSTIQLNELIDCTRTQLIRSSYDLLCNICYTADIDATHTRLRAQIRKIRNLLPCVLYELQCIKQLSDIYDSIVQLNQYLQQCDVYSFTQSEDEYDDDSSTVLSDAVSETHTISTPIRPSHSNSTTPQDTMLID